MPTCYEQLYKDMIRDINECLQLQLTEMERMESCFWIAYNYWDKLKDQLKKSSFFNDEDEIHFFRNIKPRFTSQIEYYLRLCEALQFEPNEVSKRLEFWKDEISRYDRFVQKNETFVCYYESGERYGDGMYFLRENNHYRSQTIPPPYDSEIEFCSSHDQVLRRYLALKMFKEFAEKRVEQIEVVKKFIE